MESTVEIDQSTTDAAQDAWDQEAALLEAGNSAPADGSDASNPEPIDAGNPVDAGDIDPIDNDPAGTPEPADPLAGLPDAVKAKLARIDQLEHQVRSSEGRVAAMQREFQQARQAATQVAPQDAPSKGEIATAAKNPEKWEKLKSDFPEWGEAMEEYVAAKMGGIQLTPGLDPRVVAQFVRDTVDQTKVEMTRSFEEQRIEDKYSDWKVIVNTPEFADWALAQPPEVSALANSTRAADAIRMLDSYHEAKARKATDIKQTRADRLAAAVTTRPGQTPPPRTLDDMSPDELWNYEAKQRERSRASRGF